MAQFLNLASCFFQIDDPQSICSSLFDTWSIYLTSLPPKKTPWVTHFEYLKSPYFRLTHGETTRWTQHHSELQALLGSSHLYTYETHRVDFSLYLNELSSPPQAFIQTDGSQGSLEACFQILLQISLRNQGGALIHASGAVYQNQGWLIPGPSGAGKSTAVRLGGFEHVLSDEFIAVSPASSKLTSPAYASSEPKTSSFHMWATPFWSNWDSHMFPLYHGYIPLDLIAFPQHGLMNSPPRLLPIPQLKTVTRLIEALVSYEYSESSQEYLFNWAVQISLSIPSKILSFPKQELWRHHI